MAAPGGSFQENVGQKRSAAKSNSDIRISNQDPSSHDGGVWDSVSTHHLIVAVEKYGRNWKAVAEYVGGGKSVKQCQHKVGHLVRVKLLAEPPNKRVRTIQEWDQQSNESLKLAVMKYGRDWDTIASVVSNGQFNHEQCRKRADALFKAGVLEKPPLKQIQVCWDLEATERLRVAVEKHGRDWNAIVEYVGGGKTLKQCKYKCDHLTKLGIIKKPT